MGCIPSALVETTVDDEEQSLSPLQLRSPLASTQTKYDQASSSRKETKLSPRRDCEGYPPPMIPRTVHSELVEEVEFFIEGSQKGVALACSLVKYVGPTTNTGNKLSDATKSDNRVTVTSFTKSPENSNSESSSGNVPAITFDMDPSIPIIIICHGFLSWRNQMLIGHLGIDLSYHMKCHTLRFDFTGDGHSEGVWRQGNYKSQVQDLQCVVKFIQTNMKLRNIQCIIGHSKGCVAILQHAWEQEQDQAKQQQDKKNEEPEIIIDHNAEDIKNHDDMDDGAVPSSKNTPAPHPYQYHIPSFVAMSGRFYPQDKSEMLNALSMQERQSLEERGQYAKYLVGTKRKFVATIKDFDERASLDSNFVSKIQQSSILIVHGDQDTTVPVSNATKFGRTIPNNKLWIIKGANHSFNGTKYVKVLVQGIADFIDDNNTTDQELEA